MAGTPKKTTSSDGDSYPEDWARYLTPEQKAMLSPADLRSILEELDGYDEDDAWERAEVAAVFDGVHAPELLKEESKQRKTTKGES